MFPIIAHLGPLTIYSFGLMLAVAAVVCSYLLSRDAQKFNISQDVILDFAFWTLVAGILGSRLFFILLNLGDFVKNPGEIIMITNGGLAWQGGLVVGGLTALFYIKKKKLSLGILADLSAPYLALGQSIGRIGCFLNGCCYGREVSWGIFFPAHNAHLYPTQLFESVYLLIVFFVLKFLQKNSVIRGQIFALYLMFAATGRFINEFFRADHELTTLGLSVFQIVCIFVFLTGIILYKFVRRSPKDFVGEKK